MKILVTGSAGFIGFHLARRLLEDGEEVIGLDNFNDYYSVKLKRDRQAILERFDHFHGIELDMSDYESFSRVMLTYNPGIVCNLAAQAGVRYSIEHPFVYQRSNLQGFLSVLEACRHANPQPRLVYASSSSIYGGNTKLPFSETDRVDTPVSLYAATKKANELMAHAYSHLYGLQTIGLRYFTVYGPWGRPDMAAWLFTEAMLEGRPIKVFNYGEMQRDFTYIDDIITGTLGALFSDKLKQYEIFNLGNNRSENLLEMIQVLGEALGVEPIMEMCPMQPGDVPSTWAEVDSARVKLGYEPTTPIQVGIPKFIHWFREYHAVADQ